MSENGAEALREAANLIRERAKACLRRTRAGDPEPWYSVHGIMNDPWIVARPEYPDAVHISTWSPAIAADVADWLDWTYEAAAKWPDVPFDMTRRALAVADRILRESAEVAS